MCVEKPARPALSTETSTTAPRRKRAVTERLHVFTPATPAASAPVAARPLATTRVLATSGTEPKRPQVAAAPASADESRQALEKARTLPLAEARKSALGLARTQPMAPVEPAPAPQPRRVRPVAALPVKPVAETTPIAPVKPVAEAKPIAPLKPASELKPLARVAPPAVTAGMLPPGKTDDGWSQGRKRNREPASPLRPLKVAEGTQPGVDKPAVASAPKAAGKQAAAARSTAPAMKAVPAPRQNLAEGSIPPPSASTGKPLPSLFSVIDRRKNDAQAAAPSKLPGLPPPPPARPAIGPKKAVSTVVAAASLGSAQMAIAATRQTGEHALVPPPAQLVLDDEMIEEIEEIEEDLPDFVPMQPVVSGVIARKAAPTPLFDAPPRAVAMPPAATSFSAAEAAFFAAGEEMDTIDMDTEQETFDDLPGVERPSFWSRLKNRASAG